MHPVELFLNGDLDARSDVLLTHPDVIGFLFVHEGILTKAYLPKKVVNFEAPASEDRKSIVAVSGTCSEYTPFSVSEEILLSDVFHITDCDKFIKTFPTSNITKFAKDNKSSPSLQGIILEKEELMKIGSTTKRSSKKSTKPTYFSQSIWN